MYIFSTALSIRLTSSSPAVPCSHSLHLSLFHANSFSSIFSRFYTYMGSVSLISYFCWFHSCVTEHRFIPALELTQIHYFLSWVILCCIYVPHLLYPVICQWTSGRLLPCAGVLWSLLQYFLHCLLWHNPLWNDPLQAFSTLKKLSAQKQINFTFISHDSVCPKVYF